MPCNPIVILQKLVSAGLGLLLWLGLALAIPALGQAGPDSLGGLAGRLARYEQRGPHEKLFLHLDRPLYLSGETMWFKVYAVDGTQARPLGLSSVAYVEVLNAGQQPVLHGKVALKNATGQGSFVLPATLAAGSYTVRAYTSWMKNFRPEAYFHAAVTVINTSAAAGADGQDSAAYDARFFPEGGNLVRGLRSRVGFQVTDKAGQGVAATGQVLDPQGVVVATFRTLRLGLGTFSFTPAAGAASYTAVLTPANGPTIRRQLPRPYEQGYVLRLDDSGADQLTLTVSTTDARPATVFLLGHSRQHLALATRVLLVDGKGTVAVSKSQLLAGVTHFTLFNADQQPVCERLYFQRPRQQLVIAARPDKPAYSTRDKVSLQLAANLPPAQPASLSMAVYRLDSLTTTPVVAIDHYLWLTADLKGRVENPDYYFTASGPEAAEAADNLMLTQGWSRFRWEDVLVPRPFEYLAEPYGPIVQGQLMRAGTREPRVGVMTYLSSPSRITLLSNSRSNARGQVWFELGNFTGPRELIVQTDPAQDSTAQLTIADPFSACYAEVPRRPYGLRASFAPDYTRRHLQAQVQQAFAGQYRNRYAPERVDSAAFYGRPDELYLLDKYTRFKVLEEVLREYVPGVQVRIRKDGFHLQVVDLQTRSVLPENPLVLLDGVPVFDTNKIMALNPLAIQKLEVVDSRYFHGLAVYNGIVSFTTYQGNLEGLPLDPRVLVQQYEGVQREREFYAPRYDTPQEKQSRRPDLRNLLYWTPAITLTGTDARPLEFYTGDQAGRYLVVVQGLSAAGLAGSSTFTFEVKKTL
jgi:hypothetical protein